jgi:methionine sulfoxide reductase heme-binding subunit
MTHTEPLHYIWWMVSRSAAVTAMVLISLTVALGLAMAARVVRRPGLKRAAVGLHEQCAVIGLAAIAIHGLALLGDGWLRPGLLGIAVPFELRYRPDFTAAGIIAGYLAVLLGPSFYLRRRIGTRRWRKLHRATVLVWVLAALHTLGSGSDAGQLWLRVIVLAPLPLLVYLVAIRLLGGRPAAGPPHIRHGVAASSATPGAGAVQTAAGVVQTAGGRSLELVRETSA